MSKANDTIAKKYPEASLLLVPPKLDLGRHLAFITTPRSGVPFTTAMPIDLYAQYLQSSLGKVNTHRRNETNRVVPFPSNRGK